MSDDDSATDSPRDDSTHDDTAADSPRSNDSADAPAPGDGDPDAAVEDGGKPSAPVAEVAGGALGFEVRRDRVALWLAGALVFAVVAYVAWRYVGTFVVGLFAYYVTRPVFDRIHDRIESRTAAVAVSLVTVAFPVLVLVGWTLYVAVRSLADVATSDVADQVAGFLQPYADLTATAADVTVAVQTAIEDPTRLADLEVGGVLSQSVAVLTAVVGELFAVGLHAFVVLIVTFYLLRDDYRIARWARATFVAPDGVVDRYFVAVDRDLKNVFFGNILNALLTGFLAVVTYLLLNVVAPPQVAIPEPALVGLLVGAASLVPVIGIKLVTVPIALYLAGRAALSSPETLWFPALFVVVSFVVVDYIPDQLLRPYVSGRTLHIGAVMLAYTLGPILFGWYGIFLGPMVLVVVFEFARLVVPWLTDPESVDGARAPDPDVESPAESPERSSSGSDTPSSSPDDSSSDSSGPDDSPSSPGVEPDVRGRRSHAEVTSPDDSPEGGGP